MTKHARFKLVESRHVPDQWYIYQRGRVFWHMVDVRTGAARAVERMEQLRASKGHTCMRCGAQTDRLCRVPASICERARLAGWSGGRMPMPCKLHSGAPDE